MLPCVSPWWLARRSEPDWPAAIGCCWVRAGLIPCSPGLSRRRARNLALSFAPTRLRPWCHLRPCLVSAAAAYSQLVFVIAAFRVYAWLCVAFDQQLSLAGPVGWRAFCWPGPFGLVVAGAQAAGGVRGGAVVSPWSARSPEAPTCWRLPSVTGCVTLANRVRPDVLAD